MQLTLSEVLGALSHALDITEGQPRGHAERSCLIGMALADRLDLDEDTRESLFYALLLKDSGCSSNAAKVAHLFGGDDLTAKRELKTTDLQRPAQALGYVWKTTPSSPLRKAQHIARIARSGSDGTRELITLRCERGADVVRQIGLDETSALAVRHLDEHWDGSGHPAGLQGEQISLCGRILGIAQTAEVFWQIGGPEAACDVAAQRSGSWFDPRLAAELAALRHDTRFWRSLDAPDIDAVGPRDRELRVGDSGLLRVAQAFSTVVDAKSPYTSRHSQGVAEIAVELADALNVDDAAIEQLRIAGLLHDIGKLGVPNSVLEKEGKLDRQEWDVLRMHPELSFQILSGVGALAPVARLAAVHHERLDGSGYYRGLTAESLSLPARILQVADVAEALSADRPYRPGLEPDEVLAIMRLDAGSALDLDAIDVLADVLPGYRPRTLVMAA